MQPYVDYTLLKSDATIRDFENLCHEALDNTSVIRSVCILPDPTIVELCRAVLGWKLKVCVVNDFPLGRGGLHMKLEGARMARRLGADEIDTVLDTRLLQEENYKQLLEELVAVTNVFPGATKVILETGHPWYDEQRIKKATELVDKSGQNYK